MFRFLVLICAFCCLPTNAQEEPSILNNNRSFLSYAALELQLKGDLMNDNGRENGRYDLSTVISGLSLQPEYYEVADQFPESSGGGYMFRYNVQDTDFYLLGGSQYSVLKTVNGPVYNYGLSTGLGYEVNDKVNLESRQFFNLNSDYDPNLDAYQHPVVNPLSLGIKTKF